MESLVTWFAATLGPYISEKAVVFLISMMPLLELRGGLLASSLLKVSAVQAIPICIIGNILPIPFILLFIKKIFQWMKKVKCFRGLIIKLENRAMGRSDKIQQDRCADRVSARHRYQKILTGHPVRNRHGNRDHVCGILCSGWKCCELNKKMQCRLSPDV